MTTPPEAAVTELSASPTSFTETDRNAMRSALAMARRSLGQTSPNPAVGCVILDAAGRVIARGRTQKSGRPHAEAEALAAARRTGASGRIKGGTAYVSLEPCAHTGLTPPCAEALAEAGLARVVYAIEDPDPRVAGRGHAMLAAAGATVERGLLAAEAEEHLGGYLLRLRSGRPRVTLKLASTLDGRIATRTGESRWISGPEARARAHLLRSASDAILVGAGTARADDPLLDVRLPGLEACKPVRVVADPSLTTPVGGRLVKTAKAQPLWLLAAPESDAARREAYRDTGAEIIEIERGPEGGLDAAKMLAAFGARGLNEVLCEGGGRLAASLLSAGLVDRLIWVGAGLAIGAEGAPALGPLGLDRLAEASRFALRDVRRVGADLWSEWRPLRGAS